MLTSAAWSHALTTLATLRPTLWEGLNTRTPVGTFGTMSSLVVSTGHRQSNGDFLSTASRPQVPTEKTAKLVNVLDSSCCMSKGVLTTPRKEHVGKHLL
ncbi:hypothetical protein F5J12DRAFT_832736 [Pisolithus orientalis]|uniref:uncharacterized protein n=1 Tax=Pisolithus orientalis TaxID=936130 RepID=UPI002224F827|nr:uncharacterized protein F5J12DRAFT_832736 [Pisolithus orientalis]KAI6006177.1 hypothetical protein F5J12DRAFT_832736 [Pisolithus orientalis]